MANTATTTHTKSTMLEFMLGLASPAQYRPNAPNAGNGERLAVAGTKTFPLFQTETPRGNCTLSPLVIALKACKAEWLAQGISLTHERRVPWDPPLAKRPADPAMSSKAQSDPRIKARLPAHS